MVIKEKAQTATTAGCAVLICLVLGEALEALCCPSGRREEHFEQSPVQMPTCSSPEQYLTISLSWH